MSQINENRIIAGYEVTIGLAEIYKLALERDDSKLEDLVAGVAWALTLDNAIIPNDDEIVHDMGDHIIGSTQRLDDEVALAKSKIKKIRDDRYYQNRRERPDIYSNK